MDHTDAMRRAYDLLNAGDLDGFAELLSDDFVEHEATPGLEPTKAGVVQFFAMYRAGFPDLRFEPQKFFSNGDTVAVYFRSTGTHSGEFMGMPATGKSIDVHAPGDGNRPAERRVSLAPLFRCGEPAYPRARRLAERPRRCRMLSHPPPFRRCAALSRPRRSKRPGSGRSASVRPCVGY